MEAWKGAGMDEWVGHCSCPRGVEQSRLLEQAGQEVSMGEMKLPVLGTQEITNYKAWPVLK